MAGYTRQSSYSDGDTITAAHSNDEFDQVLAAFNNSSGHKHDGTAAEGPVIGLIGDPGETTPKNKVVVDNPNNQIEVSIDVSGTSTEQVVFKDGVIEPTTDNDIDLGSSSKQFKDLHINGTANIDSLAADTANIDGGSIDGATLGTNSAITQAVIDNVNINGATIGHTDDTDLMTLASGVLTVAGEVSMTTLDIGGTNVTSTAAELNLMDGGTSAGTTAVAGSDGIVTNDGGTMRQTTVDTFDTYLAATTKTLTNKTLDADNNTVSNLEVDNLKSGVLDTDLSSVAGTDTTLASAKAIKAYVDSQVTAQDLDFQGDSGGALSIDLDSETLDIAGGTGIDTSGSGNTLTVAIDSTVATLSGSQTLSNKTIDASQLSGTVANARLDTELQALAGLTSAADKGIQFSGSGSAATYDLTAAGKALLDDADAAAQRTTLGLGTAAVTDTGISNGNVAVFTSGAADNDFLRIDGTSIEGRSASEVLSDIAAMPLAGGTFTGDVTLQQSDDGSSEDPQLILNRVSASPADNDTLGTILFRGRNDAGEVVNYAKISSQIADASDGTEDGYLNLQAPDAGTSNQTFLRIGGGEVRLFRDTLFIGDNYTVTWDKSEDTLEFGDNAKIAFGAGDDISLHWDGTDGHLAVAGTLNIEGSGETLAKFIDDGAVELYHNDSKKLETASGGVSVTGEVAATSLDISGDADIDGTLEADAITVNGTALNTVIADEATALAIALG